MNNDINALAFNMLTPATGYGPMLVNIVSMILIVILNLPW
jgi:hypothetical protein